MALNGRGPAALVFSDAEDVLTLGASVAAEMFGRPLPVLRATPIVFDVLARAKSLEISESSIASEDVTIPIAPRDANKLELTDADRAMFDGGCGPAVRQAMRILCDMAAQQGAQALVEVSQVHVDGCIYASAAHLTFAEKIAELGARVRVPTTTNAISVDHDNWRAQAVPSSFGDPASRLADAYIRMGCRPTYTCSPYLLDSAPKAGEFVGWSESNAGVFANSVLGVTISRGKCNMQ
jgi:hypothetical protein